MVVCTLQCLSWHVLLGKVRHIPNQNCTVIARRGDQAGPSAECNLIHSPLVTCELRDRQVFLRVHDPQEAVVPAQAISLPSGENATLRIMCSSD